ncbi:MULTISPECIES: VWA domain-containing protein [Pasteurellaceae]|uniref:VWA domain-containing protein n=1 Tax=Pasteurella atlantica TaxID=2827233 RepID=A0AAW8CK72_9PAST|nr:VWA domain-containing protein [Pasteurella atlantica]MDP8042807.1 VWA domain-containing protein [Pasteurella atlantica]MDP8088471.1 VWA domain-containing protein [Pasteurella atlantica]MDP8121750.1 VWA domain-containing protein [Pasteurella atlantica]MDP8141542.1 VWA domain-containing protein [Pasteurella atlantica]MDP8157459.1 VWA domain-containing protein [Pasteurella atlantica]
MTEFIQQFHFLRPMWLLLLVPLLALVWLFFRHRNQQNSSDWHSYVDAHLLKHLAINLNIKKSRPYVSWLSILVSSIFVLGIAGPTWQKTDVPSFTSNEPTVLVLSLAQSMNADDIKPSRLQRSVHKIYDILAKTQGDERGLVIYSDTSFIATPLTNDAKIIEQMLPELSTTLMPVLGNRPDLGIETATDMLQRSNAKRGRIVLLADNLGDNQNATITAVKKAKSNGYQVSILGVGTEKGALLQTSDGRKITQSGQNITMKLPVQAMEELANMGNGIFSQITPNDNDVNQLLANSESKFKDGVKKQSQKSDDWHDMGYWFLLLPAVFIAFAFRRNSSLLMLAMAFVIAPSIMPQSAYAQDKIQNSKQIGSVWKDLWQTSDQQGQQAFDSKDYQTAANIFANNDWKATANYRAKDYENAAKMYKKQKQAYNLGNALAKSGDLQGALNAYESYLKEKPKDSDAVFNRDLVKKLLEKQKKQQQQNKQDKKDKQNQKDQQGQKGKQDPKDQQGQKGKQDPKDQQGQKGKQAQEDQQGQKSKQAQKDQQGQNDKQNQKDQQAQNGKQNPKDQQGQRGKQNQEDKRSQSNAAKPTEEMDKPSEEMSSIKGIPPLDQATEQQLRQVPDDPSGLLKARIRQHYYGQ